MNAQNQFAVFGICLIVGFLGGVLYEPVSFFRLFFGRKRGKNAIVCGVLEVLFWISFTLFSSIVAFAFGFPSFRLYMSIGYICGGIIYLKSLHRILAFFEKLCYNKITQWIKKAKKSEKTLKKEVGKRL